MTAPSRETLTRMIKAGAGEAPADLVIKNVRLLDVITGAVTQTDIAIVGDRIVGTLRLLQRAADDRRRRAVRRAGLHRHPPAHRILAGDAVRVRAVRAAARRDHGDLRSARDRQRAGRRGHPLFPRMRRAGRDGHAGQPVAPACRRPSSRPRAPGSRSRTSCRCAATQGASAWPR